MREAKKSAQQPQKKLGHIDIAGNIDQMMSKRAEMLAKPEQSEPNDYDAMLDYRHKTVPRPAFLNRK